MPISFRLMSAKRKFIGMTVWLLIATVLMLVMCKAQSAPWPANTTPVYRADDGEPLLLCRIPLRLVLIDGQFAAECDVVKMFRPDRFFVSGFE